MTMATVARSKGQVYSVGNYLMTGKVLGKGHFARVEEATHRIIGKKVAIKVIDLTCIKEEYARRNLHREPRVMARLRHPCVAALYETMLHGPRLYVVMEAAGGGDLCALVAGVRGGARGLPEARARSLAAQLASAVRHMHARGVVHRDLKMENIMLDSTKQYIKIVDFGLSNVWTAGGALRTQCGSLEYAAPELFVDGRRYGPEVDLWSIGVIVYGMVTGGLPFGAEGAAGAGAQSRPQLRAAIARGFGRKHHAALAFVSPECKGFIQHLLEPRVELRMRIEEAARHRWLRRPGMRMRTHPFADVDPKVNKEIYKQIAELCGQTVMDVVAQIKAEPFGATAGMYNIKTHLAQLHAPGRDPLWSCNGREPRSASPPEYRTHHDPTPDAVRRPRLVTPERSDFKTPEKPNGVVKAVERIDQRREKEGAESARSQIARSKPVASSKLLTSGLRKPVFRVYESGDCGAASARLPSIREHSTEAGEGRRRAARPPPPAGDGPPGWRSGGAPTPPARVLLQSHATTIKRASLGNISSPHSSSNSHCKSERAAPVAWYSARGDATPLYRLRRTAPMK